MKRFTILCAIWILGLCFLISAAWAQTNANTVVVYDRQPAPANIETLINQIGLIVAGILTALTPLLAILLKMKTDKAATAGTIASVLISEVQKTGSKELKDNIASSARDAGVGDALHTKVKDETPSAPKATPRDYADELVTEWPLKTPYPNPAVDAVIRNAPLVAPTPPANEIKPI